MPRLLATALVLGTVTTGLLVTAPAASADAPAPVVSPSTVPRNGGSFTVSGIECLDPMYNPYSMGRTAWSVIVRGGLPGVSGSAFMESTQARDDGAWSVTVRWPEGIGPGVYSVQTSCEAGNVRFSYPVTQLTVTGEPDPLPWWKVPPTRPPESLPPPPPPAPRATATRPPSPSAATPTTTPPATPSATPPAPAPVSAGPAAGCADCTRVAPGTPLSAGERLGLSYTGFQPGEQVTVVMHSTPVTLGTFTADATGTVVAAVELPDDAEAGEHTLTFSGPLSGDLVVLPFRVDAARAEAAPTTTRAEAAAVSDDSSPVGWLVGGAAGVVLLGAGLVLLLRRRGRSGDGGADRRADDERDAGSHSTEEQLA